MTPRETLLTDIDHIVSQYKNGAINHGDMIRELRSQLEHRAIGEWVTVAERLPEFGWRGLVYTEPDGYNPRPTCEFTTFTHMFRPEMEDAAYAGFGPPEITHWLDLDLPKEVGG